MTFSFTTAYHAPTVIEEMEKWMSENLRHPFSNYRVKQIRARGFALMVDITDETDATLFQMRWM